MPDYLLQAYTGQNEYTFTIIRLHHCMPFAKENLTAYTKQRQGRLEEKVT